VTHHFLQCIFQHLHITKQLGSSSGGGGGAVASSYAAGGVWAIWEGDQVLHACCVSCGSLHASRSTSAVES
jgi:hypothetical protein